MELSSWLNCLAIIASFILLQTVDKRNISLCEYNEDYELVCRPPKMDEKVPLFFTYLGLFVNSVLNFSTSLVLLFNEIFVVQQGGGIHNLSILSDMYNYGTLISSTLFDMIHVIVGEPIMHKG